MGVKILVALLLFCFGINVAFGCEDKATASDCQRWKSRSFCLSSSNYFYYMKDNCQKTCGFCSDQGSCQDNVGVKDYCQAWMSYGYCEPDHRYHNYMKDNCKKTCGFCGTQPPTAKPTAKSTESSGSCSVSRKLQSCSFESDTCDFVDVPFDDQLDFKLIPGGQDNNGYLSATGSGDAEAHLILPLELLVPHNGDHGNMCMEFYYRVTSGSGSLVIYEVENAKNYPKTRKIMLSGRQSKWTKARIGFRAAQFNHLLIKASPKSGSVDIDNVRFCDTSCN